MGSAKDRRRRYVRRITLPRPGEEEVAVVTDLLDAEEYPAEELLEVYLTRWRIETCQADYPSSRRWVGTRRIGSHRRNGVARVGRVVPATPGCLHRRTRMSDIPRRRPAPPRA